MECFKLMMFGLYLIQGMFYGYVYSLPLAYPNIPDYSILGLFAAAGLPFSFKFFIAPVVQHYCWATYGKRKTWINGTILVCSLLMLPMAYYSSLDNPQNQKMTAIILFLCIFCVATKDVAVDSLAVSTLEPGTIGLYTFLGDEIGKLITLPLFLASISPDFGRQYGLQGSFISQHVYIQLTAFFGIIFVVLIHFFFDEAADTKTAARCLQRFSYIEAESDKDLVCLEASYSFSEIFAHYKKIISPAYRLCRFAALLFILNQGTEIFMESHPVELIKQNVNRQSLMLVQNLCFIPNVILSFAISRFVTSSNCLGYYFLSFIGKLLSIFLLHSISLDSQQMSIFLYGVLYVIGSINYFLQNVCINQEATDAFSGISVTLLLSISNFSRLTALQKFMISYTSYNSCINGSIIYCFIVAIMIPKLLRWLNRGISLQLGFKFE